jgi:hypothetical protein
MVREFYLVNEKGQQYSLMDLNNYCFLSSPSGLGYSYNSTYEQVGNTFIENLRELNQGNIMGELVFKEYDNYKNLIDFVEFSNTLKAIYKIPFINGIKTYYRDIKIESIEKAEKSKNGLLYSSVNFNCLSLWYEQNEIVYTIKTGENEIRWDFKWDSKFASYDNRNITFENKGHTEAPFLLQINGYVLNPSISIYVNGAKKEELKLLLDIEENEKLIYSTKDNDLYIHKVLIDGTIENIFNSSNIDLNNTNFFKLPKGLCEIRLSADNDITSAILTIYVQYISV